MKKINKLSGYKNFFEVHLIKEDIETDPDGFDKYFNKQKSEKEKAGSKSGGDLPDWAVKGLELDALKGKDADQRWDWLSKRINSVIKDKQASKVEEIQNTSLGVPSWRILWKEKKTETENQKDKSGKDIPVFYTELYKGNPGTWVDKADDGGKPGKVLGNGYWGQSSRVEKGATGSPGGILWVEDVKGPGSSSSGSKALGDMTLLDLFASTSMGKSVLNFVMGGEEFQNYLKTGEVKVTETPPTSTQIEKGFNDEQKKKHEENIKKMREMGNKVEAPNYSSITGPEYVYSPETFKLSWEKVKSALEKSGVAKKLNFNETNIIGVRNSVDVKNKYPNRFTDVIILLGPEKTKEVSVYAATTTPGIAFRYIPFRNWWVAGALKDTINPNGPAIIQPGVYDYSKGRIKGKYKTLLGEKSEIGRLSPVAEIGELKYKNFSGDKKETGFFDLDFLKADRSTPSIDSWSAGSPVFKNSDDFEDMMDKIDLVKQPIFKFALINSSDFTEK